MAAEIRLKRVGKKKQGTFRIIVTESSDSVRGPAIENLGVYNPRTDPSLVRLDAGRALHWLRSGAMPSDTVKSIFRKVGLWEQYHEGVAPEELPEQEVTLGPTPGERKTSRRSQQVEEAAAAAEAEAEEEEPSAEEPAAKADEEPAGEEPQEPEASVAEDEEEEDASEEPREPEASAAEDQAEEDADEEPQEPEAESEEQPEASVEEEDEGETSPEDEEEDKEG